MPPHHPPSSARSTLCSAYFRVISILMACENITWPAMRVTDSRQSVAIQLRVFAHTSHLTSSFSFSLTQTQTTQHHGGLQPGREMGVHRGPIDWLLRPGSTPTLDFLVSFYSALFAHWCRDFVRGCVCTSEGLFAQFPSTSQCVCVCVCVCSC